jgi:hypothetical protein
LREKKTLYSSGVAGICNRVTAVTAKKTMVVTMFDFGTMIDGNNALAVSMEYTGKPQPAQVQAIQPRQKPAQVSPSDLVAFVAGFTWLLPRLSALTLAGWTRPELFRRNRARRGIAWLARWADKDASAHLAADGCIRFTIARGGRTCTQTARPMAWHRIL